MVNRNDVFIYGLLDPRQDRLGELRYVGQSSRGITRPLELHAAKCRSWQKHVRDLGFQEDVWIIEEWDGFGDWKQWLDDTETFYVDYFKMIGCDLTNLAPGGRGVRRGYKHTAEARAKMSAGHRGLPHGPMSDEQKQKISQKLMGWKAPGRPKSRVELSCNRCNNTFEVRKSSPRAKRGGFCSRSCASRSRKVLHVEDL